MLIRSDGIRNQQGGFDVFVDGVLLDPKPSQAIVNHSPDGFCWGYGGSGPAQLALALCVLAADKMKEPRAKVIRFYHDLKWEFVADIPRGAFVVEFDLEGWARKKIKQTKENEDEA